MGVYPLIGDYLIIYLRDFQGLMWRSHNSII